MSEKTLTALSSGLIYFNMRGEKRNIQSSVVDLKLLLLNAAGIYSNFKSNTTLETYIF